MFKNLVTSEKTDLIFQALLKAWSALDAVKKDIKNEFHHNLYADINSYIETIKPILVENGLILMQPATTDATNTRQVTVETIIMHTASGQFVSNCYTMEATDTKPQNLGSATTYARRYPLASLLGLQSEVDDDGNAASGVGKQQQQQRKSPPPQQASAAKTAPAKPTAEDEAVKKGSFLKNKVTSLTGATDKNINQYFAAAEIPGKAPEPFIAALEALITIIESNVSHYGPEFVKDPAAFGAQYKDGQSKKTASN